MFHPKTRTHRVVVVLPANAHVCLKILPQKREQNNVDHRHGKMKPKVVVMCVSAAVMRSTRAALIGWWRQADVHAAQVAMEMKTSVE